MKTSLLAGAALLASTFAGHALAQQQAPDPSKPLGFFVTSEGVGKGADLGGLAGADAHCQKLASASGRRRGRPTWRAYLSTQAADATRRQRARPHRQRPLVQRPRRLVARDVAHLHGDTARSGAVGQ